MGLEWTGPSGVVRMRKRSPSVGLGAWVTSYSTPCSRGCTTRGAAVGSAAGISHSSVVTLEPDPIWIHSSVRLSPTAAPRVVQPRGQGVEYEVTHAPSPTAGDRFLILTHAAGPENFKPTTATYEELRVWQASDSTCRYRG